jgi:hypothetical protein
MQRLLAGVHNVGISYLAAATHQRGGNTDAIHRSAVQFVAVGLLS